MGFSLHVSVFTFVCLLMIETQSRSIYAPKRGNPAIWIEQAWMLRGKKIAFSFGTQRVIPSPTLEWSITEQGLFHLATYGASHTMKPHTIKQVDYELEISIA